MRFFMLLLVLLTAGCTSQGREGEVVLRFWAMGREGEVVRELVPAFEAENPGIRVRVQQIPWTAAHEKLLTSFVGEATPDVVQMGNTWIPEFVALDALEPLGPYLGTEGVEQADYFPGIWATNEIDGVPYGIPWYVDTRLVFYRKDLFAKAGYDTFPTTWAAWQQAMEDVKAVMGPGNYPIFLPLNEWNVPIILGMQNDSDLLRENGRYGDFSGEAFREAFRFYIGLFRSGYAPPAAGTQVSNVYQEMARGYIAQFITGPWNLGEFARRMPDSLQSAWATAPIPGPDGPGASTAGGSSLAIFRASEHKEAAWKLVAYLSRPDVQLEFYRLTGSLPARRAAWRDSVFTSDPRVQAFEQQLERATPTPKVPEWERIATKMQEYAEAAARGALSEEEALRRFDADVDEMLEKRRYLLDREAALQSEAGSANEGARSGLHLRGGHPAVGAQCIAPLRPPPAPMSDGICAPPAPPQPSKEAV